MRRSSKLKNLIKETGGTPRGRALKGALASCVSNSAIGMGKLIVGIISLSFFTCAGALYTFGMVGARLCAISGMLKDDEDHAAVRRSYAASGMILTAASLLYIIYSIRLFFSPADSYNMYTAIAIAAFTFIELPLNVRRAIVESHSTTLPHRAIRTISIASSLICLVLTQTALLSFSATASAFTPGTNAVMALLMGCAASALGIGMIVGARPHKGDKTKG